MDGADKKIKAGFWEEFDVSDLFKGYSLPAVDEPQVLHALESQYILCAHCVTYLENNCIFANSALLLKS